MTCLEKLRKAERWRITTGKMASDATYGWNGHFLVPLEGQIWLVRISDEMGWRHLSVSNSQNRKLPDWMVLRRLKEAFYADEEWACQYFPAREEYINDCQWCLHLWSPLNDTLPTPSFVLV
jgi:hypothetical protein